MMTCMNRTDEQLAAEAMDGNEHAFKALMERYIRNVFNFSLHYARNAEDAEDIVQDAFFKVWKNLKRYSAERPFRPWLFTIVRNTALDHLKKRRSIRFSEFDTPEEDMQFRDTLVDPEPLPPEIFENAEAASVLETALKELHPDRRAVLMLHYREEMTFEEIAVTMEKPMNTVKSWHRRALERIRPLLEKRLRDAPKPPKTT